MRHSWMISFLCLSMIDIIISAVQILCVFDVPLVDHRDMDTKISDL
jgi:hypothetical protein